MRLKFFLILFLSCNVYANPYIQNINNFLEADRFSYEQVSYNSSEIISGKLILDPLQIYLEILSPYRESYLISKNFITYNDIDFSQQRTFEYSISDYPLIGIISKKKIPQGDNSFNIITLEDSIYITEKSTKQVFRFSFKEDDVLVIQFKDNAGIENSIFLKELA